VRLNSRCRHAEVERGNVGRIWMSGHGGAAAAGAAGVAAGIAVRRHDMGSAREGSPWVSC